MFQALNRLDALRELSSVCDRCVSPNPRPPGLSALRRSLVVVAAAAVVLLAIGLAQNTIAGGGSGARVRADVTFLADLSSSAKGIEVAAARLAHGGRTAKLRAVGEAELAAVRQQLKATRQMGVRPTIGFAADRGAPERAVLRMAQAQVLLARIELSAGTDPAVRALARRVEREEAAHVAHLRTLLSGPRDTRRVIAVR
jgi:hypothetical protein